MRVNLCRDPALVTGACLRIQTRRNELFVWREGWRVRVWRSRRPWRFEDGFDDGTEPYDPDVM
jgi:hypothetical protein